MYIFQTIYKSEQSLDRKLNSCIYKKANDSDMLWQNGCCIFLSTKLQIYSNSEEKWHVPHFSEEKSWDRQPLSKFWKYSR